MSVRSLGEELGNVQSAVIANLLKSRAFSELGLNGCLDMQDVINGIITELPEYRDNEQCRRVVDRYSKMIDRVARLGQLKASKPDATATVDQLLRRIDQGQETDQLLQDIDQLIGAAPPKNIWSQLRMQERLGEGTYGTVVKVRAGDGNDYALKILKKPDPSLKQEIDSLTELSSDPQCHPGIVCYYGMLKVPTNEGPKQGVIMEYIPGQSLDSLATQVTTNEQVEKLLRTSLEALAYAHGKGIAHRDIKPANIMQDNGNAVLIDFGLSCHFNLCKGIAGTPNYLAPEVLARRFDPKQQIDWTKADVFSLGTTFYKILTGRKPDWLPSIKQPIRVEKLELARSRLPKTPVGMAVNAMMNPDPSQRPSAEQVLATLN